MFSASDVMTAMTFESDKHIPGAKEHTSQPAYIIKEDTPENVAILERYLQNGEFTSFRLWARGVGRKPSYDQAVLDGLAEIIYKERNSDNGYLVDGLCHLCKTFLRSRQPRYKSFFEWLKENGGTSKLRRYAVRTSKSILMADVPQFQPWKEEERVAEPAEITEKAEVAQVAQVPEVAEVASDDVKPPAEILKQKTENLQNIPKPDSQTAEKKSKQISAGAEKKIQLSIYIDELGYDGVGESAHSQSNVSMMFYAQKADIGYEHKVLDNMKDKSEFHQRVLSVVNRNLKNRSITPVKLYMSGMLLEEINRNSLEDDMQSCSLTMAADLLFEKILLMFMSIDSSPSPFDLQINLVGFGNGAVVGKHLLNLLSGVNTELGKNKISFNGAVFFDPVISVDHIDMKSCGNLMVHYPRIAKDGPEILEIIAANADRKTYPLVVYKKSPAEQKSMPGRHM